MSDTDTIKRLNALRAKQPKDSRAHGIISNLIEQLDSLRKETDPGARERLMRFAADSVELIERLTKAGE